MELNYGDMQCLGSFKDLGPIEPIFFMNTWILALFWGKPTAMNMYRIYSLDTQTWEYMMEYATCRIVSSGVFSQYTLNRWLQDQHLESQMMCKWKIWEKLSAYMFGIWVCLLQSFQQLYNSVALHPKLWQLIDVNHSYSFHIKTGNSRTIFFKSQKAF